MAQNGNDSPTSESESKQISAANSTTPSIESLPTKMCHIVKRPDFEGYGFNLHSEKSKPGQFIGKVDANSPAESAGLKEGDRIIEVNGVPIGNETHKQVVQRIKAISCEVRLLLIDVEKLSLAEPSLVEGQGTILKMPGASANISSISMSSTKRVSNASSNSRDVTDKAIPSSQNGTDAVPSDNQSANYNNNNNMKTPPPPPSATVATVAASNNVKGGLQLPTTAAEMRAKLLSRKKYDPKNEGVDLKKKFEIIQKL